MAVGWAALGDGLIEAHGRSAAAMPEEENLADPRLPPKELDSAADVQRIVLPSHGGFVIVGTWVHREHQKPSLREFLRADVREEVRRSVRDQDADVRRWAGIGPVQCALDRVRRELDIGRIWLGESAEPRK